MATNVPIQISPLTRRGLTKMLWTIIIILLILWLLGLIGGYTMGGIIHVLLVVAVIILILNLVRGRRVV